MNVVLTGSEIKKFDCFIDVSKSFNYKKSELTFLADSFKLVVENGYGGGKFEAGDTVHIWASTPNNTKTFATWAGEVSGLDEKTNWHTTLIMPAKDISISATYSDLPGNLEYKRNLIKGPFSDMELYTYFPDKDKVKGVIWLFQGSGGRGKYWVTKTEGNELLDLLVAHDYAVITMDAEEISQNKDLDNSGNIGFQYTSDTLNNPDMVNLKFFRNYFINAGKFGQEIPQVAIGFSNGGAFAEIVASVYDFAGSLSFNTPGSEFLSQNSPAPHFQNNSFNDDSPSVGQEGNVSAEAFIQNYQSRDILSKWILQKPQPLHKERFARIEGASVELSILLFNYVKGFDLLDERNYFKIDPDLVQKDIETNPGKYPGLQILSPEVLSDIIAQCKVTYTNHLIRSDYNGSALKFINQIIDIKTSTKEERYVNFSDKFFYPNPAHSIVRLQDLEHYFIYDLNGAIVKNGRSETIDISALNNGIYILNAGKHIGRLIIVHE